MISSTSGGSSRSPNRERGRAPLVATVAGVPPATAPESRDNTNAADSDPKSDRRFASMSIAAKIVDASRSARRHSFRHRMRRPLSLRRHCTSLIDREYLIRCLQRSLPLRIPAASLAGSQPRDDGQPPVFGRREKSAFLLPRTGRIFDRPMFGRRASARGRRS